MAKEKACRSCKTVFEGAKCPNCGSSDVIEGFKGKIAVLNPDESEIAKKLGLSKKGIFAVRLR